MKRAEHQPVTEAVYVYGGIYYKVWSVPDAGTLIPQHAHRYDHLTALLRGSVQVFYDGRLGPVVDAPNAIRVEAGIKHAFQTLVPDCQLACIHNADHAEADGEPPIVAEHHLVTED